MNEVMLTTTNNPWNPFTHFDEWFQFDEEKGYHTCSYLARITTTSTELSDAEQEEDLRTAINEIIKFDLLSVYTTISRTETAPKTMIETA